MIHFRSKVLGHILFLTFRIFSIGNRIINNKIIGLFIRGLNSKTDCNVLNKHIKDVHLKINFQL